MRCVIRRRFIVVFAPEPRAHEMIGFHESRVEDHEDERPCVERVVLDEELTGACEGVADSVGGEESRMDKDSEEAVEVGGFCWWDFQGGDEVREGDGLAVGIDGVGDAELDGAF
ncbi:hypothetical protein LINPERPRIM_LOCUS3322 [Linum perenne]